MPIFLGASGAPEPPALVPLLQEVREGRDLCLFVVRMRLRNRLLVDGMRSDNLDAAARLWPAQARAELWRMAQQAGADGRRAGALRDESSTRTGTATSPHDYRQADAVLLDRRAQVGSAVERVLRQAARSARQTAAVLADAAVAAASDMAVAAGAPARGEAERDRIRERAEQVLRLAGARSTDGVV